MLDAAAELAAHWAATLISWTCHGLRPPLPCKRCDTVDSWPTSLRLRHRFEAALISRYEDLRIVRAPIERLGDLRAFAATVLTTLGVAPV